MSIAKNQVICMLHKSIKETYVTVKKTIKKKIWKALFRSLFGLIYSLKDVDQVLLFLFRSIDCLYCFVFNFSIFSNNLMVFKFTEFENKKRVVRNFINFKAYYYYNLYYMFDIRIVHIHCNICNDCVYTNRVNNF